MDELLLREPSIKKATQRRKLIEYTSSVLDNLTYDNCGFQETEFLIGIDDSIRKISKILTGNHYENGKRVWKWKDRIRNVNNLLKGIEYHFVDNPQTSINRKSINKRIEQIRYVLDTGLSGKYLNSKHKTINFLKRAKSRADSLDDSIDYVRPFTLENRDFVDVRDLIYDVAEEEKKQKWVNKLRKNILMFMPAPEEIEYEPDEKRIKEMQKHLLTNYLRNREENKDGKMGFLKNIFEKVKRFYEKTVVNYNSARSFNQ